MSHGASTVTKATQSTAKGGLSQAEVWEKVSAIQKGLSGFLVQFAMLDKALRAFAPTTLSDALITSKMSLRYKSSF